MGYYLSLHISRLDDLRSPQSQALCCLGSYIHAHEVQSWTVAFCFNGKSVPRARRLVSPSLSNGQVNESKNQKGDHPESIHLTIITTIIAAAAVTTMTWFSPDTPETRIPLIVSTFFGVLASLSFIARLYSVGVPHSRPRLEDWLILAALILVYVSLGIQWACVTLGGTGRHITEVEARDPSAVVLTLQLILPFEALYGVTLMLVKFSMLRFYARIFSINRVFTLAVWSAAVVIFLWMVSVVLETFLLCRPLAYNWDTTIDGTCGNRQAVYVGAGVSNMVTDFMVLLLPIPFVWRLRMPTASKMSLLGIFCLGILYVLFILFFFSPSPSPCPCCYYSPEQHDHPR